MNKRVITYLFIILLVLNSGLAQEEEEIDYTNSGSVNKAVIEGTVKWDEVTDLKMIDTETVQKIPNDVVANRFSELGDAQRANLNAEQLSSVQTLNSASGSEGNLDPQAYSDALSQVTGQSVQVNPTNQPTNNQITPQGVSMQNAPSLNVDGTGVSNGQNVAFNQNQLTAQSASQISTDNSIISNVQNAVITPTEFYVESADKIEIQCNNGGTMTANNVKDSTLSTIGNVKIEMGPNTEYDMTDCSGAKSTFISLGEESELIVTKDSVNPNYQLKKVRMITKKQEITEIVDADNTAEIIMDKNFGMEQVTIDPIGTYYYQTGDQRKDFAFKMDAVSHTLFLRKDISQQFDLNCVQCTLMDFPEKNIASNGMVTYLRYWWNNNAKPYYLIDLNLQPMYLPLSNTAAMLKYDDELLYFTPENIVLNSPVVKTTVSNYLTIHEKDILGATHRLVDINYKLDKNMVSQNLVTEYRTEYSPSIAMISNNVYQEDNIVILPPGHSMIRELIS